LRSEAGLSLEQFENYVAQAKAERAKAIAEFFGHLAASLYGTAARLALPRRIVGAHDRAKLQTAAR
jgi:hypothetical protein